MLLVNTTSELATGQVFSTLDDQIKCLADIQSSVEIHSLIVLLIHFVTLSIIVALILGFSVAAIVSPDIDNFIDAIESYIPSPSNTPEERHYYVFLLFIKEVALTSVYVLFAFLYKWFGLTNSDSPVTSQHFHRWIVEGTFAPYLFCRILVEYYTECLITTLDQYQALFILTIILRFPMYFFMRFAESQPDFFLNRLESDLMITFCKSGSREKTIVKLFEYFK